MNLCNCLFDNWQLFRPHVARVKPFKLNKDFIDQVQTLIPVIEYVMQNQYYEKHVLEKLLHHFYGEMPFQILNCILCKNLPPSKHKMVLLPNKYFFRWYFNCSAFIYLTISYCTSTLMLQWVIWPPPLLVYCGIFIHFMAIIGLVSLEPLRFSKDWVYP